MKVTEVKLFPSTAKTEKVKAYGNVVFDGSLSINVTIFQGKDGPYVGWPGYKNTKDGKWNSYVFFKEEELKNSINKEVLNKFSTLGSSTTKAPSAAAVVLPNDENVPF